MTVTIESVTEPDWGYLIGDRFAPLQDVRIKGLESSQEHEDPIGLLEDLDTVVLEVYLDDEYQFFDVGPYDELDQDVADQLLEWLSPT
jgi:hypothetical protein